MHFMKAVDHEYTSVFMTVPCEARAVNMRRRCIKLKIPPVVYLSVN